MKALALLLALLPLTVWAFPLTYDGELITDDSMVPHKVTEDATIVTEYMSIVTLSPVRDATDGDGGRHCFYVIDHEFNIKVMISAQRMTPGTFIEMPGWIDLLILAHIEAKKDGGVEALSERCGHPLDFQAEEK